MLTTTTHSKLREALDGTDTQVATCAIDRWTAKMKRIEGYITREISQREGDGSSEDARKFYWSSIRRGEEEIILGWGPRVSFDLSPNHAVDDLVPQWSRPTVEGVLTKAQFSSPLLYQIHCIGPIGFGFGFAHIYSERSPSNRDPTLTNYNTYTIKMASITVAFVSFNFKLVCSLCICMGIILKNHNYMIQIIHNF